MLNDSPVVEDTRSRWPWAWFFLGRGAKARRHAGCFIDSGSNWEPLGWTARNSSTARGRTTDRAGRRPWFFLFRVRSWWF